MVQIGIWRNELLEKNKFQILLTFTSTSINPSIYVQNGDKKSGNSYEIDKYSEILILIPIFLVQTVISIMSSIWRHGFGYFIWITTVFVLDNLVGQNMLAFIRQKDN